MNYLLHYQGNFNIECTC